MTAERQIADTFVEARRIARGFRDFPGALPSDLGSAYRIQKDAIASWGDTVAGWKVGRVQPQLAEALGAERYVGAIFARSIVGAGATNDFSMTPGGSALFEAEAVIVMSADAPADKMHYTADEAADLVGAVRVAVEIAGSPLETMNELSTVAAVAGFGNNNGLILGAEVTDWRQRGWEGIVCRTTIDGVLAREATAAMVPGGPLDVFAYALGQTARLGFPLRRGDVISTGAITGMHPVTAGQHCVAEFVGIETFDCRIVVARPDAV